MDQLHSLLEVAVSIAQDNTGVALASAPFFASRSTAGVLTVISDASRAAEDDGFGGYAFLTPDTRRVFVMAAAWPVVLKRAMDLAAAPVATRRDSPGALMFSMPAAEVFATVVLALAAAERVPILAVVAIMDCSPATAAVTRLFSGSAQIHLILRPNID